jgi:hypothetical protein
LLNYIHINTVDHYIAQINIHVPFKLRPSHGKIFCLQKNSTVFYYSNYLLQFSVVYNTFLYYYRKFGERTICKTSPTPWLLV